MVLKTLLTLFFRLFPEVFPRPEIEVLPMNVPLINPKTDLSVQEADLMVNRNLEGTVTGNLSNEIKYHILLTKRLSD